MSRQSRIGPPSRSPGTCVFAGCPAAPVDTKTNRRDCFQECTTTTSECVFLRTALNRCVSRNKTRGQAKQDTMRSISLQRKRKIHSNRAAYSRTSTRISPPPTNSQHNRIRCFCQHRSIDNNNTVGNSGLGFIRR